ncbi:MULTISPECIES: Mu transposase C-terminal domain-containing protein [Aeromicrobium]|uniref:Mu transposase C-terminal domain-containing protein n=1 Tax=Aeromicrobium TaxID=2040 RepID=UPI00257B69A3|nr:MULTISPECIES: Mu transposase C-terminal domain-containing protein [Aeromicrobium]
MSVTSVQVGSSVLTTNGLVLVEGIERYGALVRDSHGARELVEFTNLVFENDDVIDATIMPWWPALPESTRQTALFRLEVIQEILTGFRSGIAELRQLGEPFSPFDTPESTSLRTRVNAMVAQLEQEDRADRQVARTGAGARGAKRSTVYGWLRAYERDGLRGLVDGRSTRGRKGFDALDSRFLKIADDVFAQFDGSVSKVNLAEFDRRIAVAMKQAGIEDADLPERLKREYLSHRWRALGSTTRAHRSRSQRKVSSTASYPAVHPSHVVIDATRADNLVWDELQERPYSVEILTVMSVATRVIVALRVTPRSSRTIEAGLALYDTMRPFSMVVSDDHIDDFRWCGVPESLDFSDQDSWLPTPRASRPDRDLKGVHYLPGVRPSSLRADHGSIFVSAEFRDLLRSFGIDLMLSRGSKPTDNPHVERWHETLQRAYQQIPGFKGRAVHERGRFVGMTAGEPLLTARELEQHLKRFVALDYHRTPHRGLFLPGATQARLTPLEMWDAMIEATGRIHVPQHPDLIFQFLPIVWRKVRHDGVTIKGLTYDDRILDDFRELRNGAFRAADEKAPFHHDPRDVTRIWFRHPDTGRIHEIGWRARHLVHAPMVDVVRDKALALIKERGGNRVIDSHTAETEIIAQLTELTRSRSTEEWRTQMSAARLRHEQALIDHAEVTEARRIAQAEADLYAGAMLLPERERPGPGAEVAEEPWPDLDELA